MRRSSVKEYIELMQQRYQRARRTERGHLLDEIISGTGYHRKSAARLMSSKKAMLPSRSAPSGSGETRRRGSRK